MKSSHYPWQAPVAALVALLFIFGTSLASQPTISPLYRFSPAQEYENGFLTKDLYKLFGKQTVKLAVPFPQVDDEEDANELLESFELYIVTLSEKKLGAKPYKRQGAALYAKVAGVCAQEELDCREDLEKLRVMVKGGTKPKLLKTMREVLESVKEKLEDVSSELEEEEDESLEDEEISE